jgi:hypothetical protein
MALAVIHDVRPAARRRHATVARPELEVVPARRRWPAVLAGALWAAVSIGLLGAAVFHTQLAERQLRIDRLERAVVAERERFDELRYERAELRSPVRLAEAATALGMRRGESTEFLEVSPEALARQIAAAGAVDDVALITTDSDPLDQYRSVKAVTGAQR